jgi:hypothetical protein
MPWKTCGVLATLTLFLLCSDPTAMGQELQTRNVNQSGERMKANPALAAAIEKLKMPGVTIHLAERCVDIAAKICLDKGMLELVACTPGTKEHESIVVIEARPMHIHTGLLLLGSEPGSPALRSKANGEVHPLLFTHPKGDAIDVYLVFPDKTGKQTEHPINEFIARTPMETLLPSEATDSKETNQFPTHAFLFAGSQLIEDGRGPRKYLSDESGNVISIVTFGDEMLCLSGVHSDQKDQLIWQVNATGLPAVGTKVLLRLRPQSTPHTKEKSLNEKPLIEKPREP